MAHEREEAGNGKCLVAIPQHFKVNRMLIIVVG